MSISETGLSKRSRSARICGSRGIARLDGLPDRLQSIGEKISGFVLAIDRKFSFTYFVKLTIGITHPRRNDRFGDGRLNGGAVQRLRYSHRQDHKHYSVTQHRIPLETRPDQASDGSVTWRRSPRRLRTIAQALASDIVPPVAPVPVSAAALGPA